MHGRKNLWDGNLREGNQPLPWACHAPPSRIPGARGGALFPDWWQTMQVKSFVIAAWPYWSNRTLSPASVNILSSLTNEDDILTMCERASPTFVSGEMADRTALAI